MKPVSGKGRLIRWKDDRGFGFIQPSDGSQEVFVHISAFKEVKRRPQVGDFIHYQLTVDKNGKARACNASLEEGISSSVASAKVTSKAVRNTSPLVFKTLLLSLIPGLGSIHFLLTTSNPIFLIIYPVMSFITFALYADDKSRAKQGQWRVPEKTLHLCEFFGGWLGAFVAQGKLHHKSSKVSYQIVFWVIVTLHIVFWLDWLFFGKALISLLLGNTSGR